jgi:hypothetical protein
MVTSSARLLIQTGWYSVVGTRTPSKRVINLDVPASPGVSLFVATWRSLLRRNEGRVYDSGPTKRRPPPTEAELARARRWWIEDSGLTRAEIESIARAVWS